jgi:uroporphyrinogen-III synthase
MRLLLTRPEQDSLQTAALLHTHGIESVIAPLFDVVDCAPDVLPDLTPVQALIFTSRNAVTHFAKHFFVPALPAYCVGEQTAEAARYAGFSDVFSADGDKYDLVALIRAQCQPEDGSLLRLMQDMPHDDLVDQLNEFDINSVALYKMHEKQVDIASALTTSGLDGVTLYSPKTAARFRDCVLHAGLAEGCRTLTAWCISKATADALSPLEFLAVHHAERPTQQSLINLIRDISNDT